MAQSRDDQFRDEFRQFVNDDGTIGPNGYVMALEAVLDKCSELRRRGYGDLAAEVEQVFVDYFGIARFT